MSTLFGVCRKLVAVILVATLFEACQDSEKRLRQCATQLCQYVPDHELREESKPYMTDDFYATLDTMFNHLPEFEAMDHEWLYYFVTGNGGTIADYTVTDVKMTDKSHAEATVMVRQKWEDGSFDESTDVEEHTLSMEKAGGKWLMSDFDGHKADCLRHIAIARKEQSVRDAIGEYLVREVGESYLKGELCVPTMIMVHEEDNLFMGDFWVLWYNRVGDTLKCVSGGNHSGVMTLALDGDTYRVTAFEQTVDGAGNDASARRIFGEYYDIYQGIHSNERIREVVRQEQLRHYLDSRNIDARYYQDYGHPAVALRAI